MVVDTLDMRHNGIARCVYLLAVTELECHLASLGTVLIACYSTLVVLGVNHTQPVRLDSRVGYHNSVHQFLSEAENA